MHWLEVRIDTNHAGLETVQALLSGLDVDGVMIEDEEEFQDFLEHNHEYWDYVDEDLERAMSGRSRITFYLEAKEAGFAKLGEVRIALEALKQERKDLGTLLMTLEDVQDADWENNWKQYYKPMEIGERLLVIPQWEEADPGDRVPLYLDPGLTFGTGAHATTRLCLTALESLVRGGERVLDLGCGSGILSVAALRLGADEVITEIKFEFGTVQAGFHQVEAPYILCQVNGDLPNEYRFTNKTDVGGQRGDEWVIAKDQWTTIIYAKPKGKLPKTGF